MGKAESQQPTNLVDTVQTYSSPACWMHEVDPGYLGYWSEEEVVVFLEVLLEQERGGTKAFANIGQAADLQISDLILESELDQVEICVLLKEEIAVRRTTVAAPANGWPKNIAPNAVLSGRSHSRQLIRQGWSRRSRKPFRIFLMQN